nr:hypothetical protein [Modestobacter versicolor]
MVAAGWVDPRGGRQGGRQGETGATAAVVPGQRTEGEPAPPPDQVPAAAPVPGPEVEAPAAPAPAPAGDPGPTAHPTTPVDVAARPRPRPRLPRRDPLTRMGPWAPVAGAAVGLLLGVVVVLLLAPAVDTFAQRLSLVFVVLGLALLGAGGTLLADEVRLLRRGTQAAEVRSADVGAIAGLLNGLTPARLLITASAFSLLLSAYVTRG